MLLRHIIQLAEGPVGIANAGPIVRPFGPMISRAQHDDDLEAAFERGASYISGGALPGDGTPNNVETAPAPRRFRRAR